MPQEWSTERPDEDFHRVLDPDGELQGDPPAVDDDELRRWYRTFVETRTLEDKMLNMQRSGEASLVTQSRGEEATTLGTAAALAEDDWLFYTYRQNSALLYWDVPMAQVVAGSMGHEPETMNEHIDGDPGVNVPPGYVPIGVNVGNAAGCALADQYHDRDAVTMAYIGDGSTSEGDFHEGMNFAGVFDAPLVVVCQNNQWAISQPSKRQSDIDKFEKRAEAYGIPHVRVDGNDAFAVYEKTKEAVERARNGEGPTLVECVTFRMGSHNTSDNADLYRDEETEEYWAERDPVDRFESYLREEGVIDDDAIEEIESDADEAVDDAVAEARDVPDSDPELMFDHHLHGSSWSDSHQRAEFAREQAGENPYVDYTGDEFDLEEFGGASGAPLDAEPLDPDESDTEEMDLVEAVNAALDGEMGRDEDVALYGYDIGHLGGVYRATEGLMDEYGEERVVDTPLSESGILGATVGMAMRDLRPVPEIQFKGFAYPAFGQFMYTMIKTYKRSGGDIDVPLTLRMPYSGGIKSLEYHSESTETFEIHAPGVRVICPSTPYEAKGLLASSVRSDDPVVFLEPKRIYREREESVPTDDYTLPLDEARIAREGEDVTLVTWGAMFRHAEAAAEAVDADVEIVDLRSLSPLDTETILESVRKTGRLVVLHEARRTLGLGAEISALVNEYALASLKAPVKRATGFDVHFPNNDIEQDYLPDEQRAQYAIEAVMDYEF